ncbi:MAG: hypothetical protein J6I73_08470 [Treponema sp.]|nr:hypothetical protein [Treponema sp.]
MGASFKKALLLIPTYLWLLLSLIIIGELAYMVYFNTVALVAGRPLSLFSGNALASGIYVVVPVVLIFSSLFLSFYRVRHSGGGWPPVLAYIVLCAATWCALYPFFISFKSKTPQAANAPHVALTAGYFRPHAGGVYYLSHDFTRAQMNAVVFSAAVDTISMSTVYREDVAKEAHPFYDILIKETVPLFPAWIGEGISAIISRAEYAWKNGWISWLCFLSFAFALCAAYALTFCSDWRLVGIVYLLIMEAGVLSCNMLYYSDYFALIRNLDVMLAMRMPFLFSVNEPLLVIANMFVGMLCILIGLLASHTRSKKQRRG